MSSLLLPRRLTSQPQGAVTLDPNHWLAKDVIFVHTGFGALVNGSTAAPKIDTASYGFSNAYPGGPQGYGPIPDGSGYLIYDVAPVTEPVTLSVWFSGPPGATNDFGIFLKNNAADTGLALQRRSTEAYVIRASVAGSAVIATTSALISSSAHVVGVSTGSTNRVAYLNGALEASVTTSRVMTTLNEVRLLVDAATSACTTTIKTFMLPMIINRALDEDEVNRLYNEQSVNPWSLFRVSENAHLV